MLNRLSRLQTSEDRSSRLVRTLLKAFGLMLAFAGLVSVANEFQTAKRMVQVTGKIYTVYERDQGGSQKYVPAIEFWINDGQVFHFQGPASSTKPEIGTSVPVVYNIGKPELAQIDGFARRWLLASIAIPLGFVMLIAAAFWRKS